MHVDLFSKGHTEYVYLRFTLNMHSDVKTSIYLDKISNI